MAVATVTPHTLRKVGRWIREVDPETAERRATEYGETTLEDLGRALQDCDPEYFVHVVRYLID